MSGPSPSHTGLGLRDRTERVHLAVTVGRGLEEPPVAVGGHPDDARDLAGTTAQSLRILRSSSEPGEKSELMESNVG